jgi:excinuclease ABC subunit C
LLNKIFKLRTCRKLPKRACLRYSLGLCSAPCINKISKEEYNNSIESAKMVLSGKTKELIETLKEKMKSFSKLKEFESALRIKEQIESLESLEERQAVERKKSYNENVLVTKVKENQILHFNLCN